MKLKCPYGHISEYEYIDALDGTAYAFVECLTCYRIYSPMFFGNKWFYHCTNDEHLQAYNLARYQMPKWSIEGGLVQALHEMKIIS